MHYSITGTLSLKNVSVPAVHPRNCILHTKPGVWTGLGMELATAQAALPHSTANGTASNAYSLIVHSDFERNKTLFLAIYTIQTLYAVAQYYMYYTLVFFVTILTVHDILGKTKTHEM